ncbi:MAG: hypothetical protein NT105_01850 [Verrucomicrobia bacterium]|nr:hypothetical protein [Verrucomicrobiota bacterium]
MSKTVFLFCLAVSIFCASQRIPAAAEPLRVRMENFIVTPSTGPLVNVHVQNRSDRAVNAVLRVRWPEGWKGAPGEQTVSVGPNAMAKAAFTVEKAIDLAVNRYAVVVEARAGDVTVTRTQHVICATAPYLKPQVDGKLDDWKDAVPITFATASKATTVMTCWNRKQFCVAVRAEQLKGGAVQFSLAPEAGEKPGRYEFVVVAPEQDGPAKCFLLMRPGDDLKLAAQSRALEGLECGDVQAATARDGGAMCFEIAVPVKLVPELQPTPGRPFRFSLLVHEAGGLRDLGAVMNLWDDQRHPQSWSRWKGAAFGPTPPFDSNIEFGFSSSIH